MEERHLVEMIRTLSKTGEVRHFLSVTITDLDLQRSWLRSLLMDLAQSHS